ncbi:MAG: YqhA family protein [Rubrimonas sp.]|uniref:YqhA family protein n=1 Tax=Rubrimonas sp. TaxID=2036015 RepID=UPI002FDD8C8D
MVEQIVQKALSLTRWLLAPFYAALSLVMLLLLVGVAKELWALFGAIAATDSSGLILATLTIIDLALVATLVVMVVLSGFQNYVTGFREPGGGGRPEALRRFDPGGLKLKLSAAIVAISSIHLLKSFMRIEELDRAVLPWMIGMHLTFVATTVLLALTERLKTEQDG